MSDYSPLLELPAELRNNIYRYALVSDDPIYITPDGLRTRKALLQTCEQIKNEATGIFYAENVFITKYAVKSSWLRTANESREFPFRWLASIGPANAEAISKFVIEYELPKVFMNGARQQGQPGGRSQSWPFCMVQRDCEVDMRAKAKEVVAMVNIGLAESCVELLNRDCLDPTEETVPGEVTRHMRSVFYDTLSELMRLRAKTIGRRLKGRNLNWVGGNDEDRP